MRQTEEDEAKWSPDIVVLGERSTPISLTPSIAEGGVLTGTSWQEGSAVLGASGESSLALTSVGGDMPTRGKLLLQWTNLEHLASTLFTLDDTAESMERKSLDMGIASMLEALDHARGSLGDVVVPAGQVFA